MSSPGERASADALPDPWERYSWLLALVWLPFLWFPVSDLLDVTGSGEASVFVLVAGWVGTVAFPALFLGGFIAGMRSGWGVTNGSVIVLFGGLVTAVALTIPTLGWGSLSFLPFLMAYATFAMQGRWHTVVTIAGVAVAAGVWLLPGAAPRINPVFVGIVVLLAFMNSAQSWLIGRSVGTERLRLELTASGEREDVARDVHDLIGHTLTVVKLKAELAAKVVHTDPDRAQAELEAIAALTAESIAGVRGAVTGLRATDLSEQLSASKAALGAAGVTTRFEGDAASLSPAQAITASWILREATTNIIRHARAREVGIEVRPGTMLIVDDGDGRQGPAGNGVRGMSERAAASGALLSIDDPPQGGTSVRVQW